MEDHDSTACKDEVCSLCAAQTAVQLAKEQANVRYFYSTDTPHAWSSGPTMHYLDTDRDYAPIESLERARELALAARKGKPGYDGWVKTAYGAVCNVD